MKKIIVIIVLITTYYNSNAQFLQESQEIIDKDKYPRVNYLGTIDNSIYYAQFKIKKVDEVIITFNKINQSNLTVSHPIDINLNVSKDLIYKTDYIINMYVKNNFVYIFYCLIDTKVKPTTFRLFMKVLNKDLKEINTQQFIPSQQEGNRFLGNYTVHFSNNEKRGLVNLIYTSNNALRYYESKSELQWINLETNTIDEKYYIALKDRNSETVNSPLNSSFTIFNNGNVAFLMRDIVANDKGFIKNMTSVSIGLIKYKSNSFLNHTIELSGQDTSIKYNLLSLKTEKAIFLGITRDRYIYRYIDMEKCAVEFEKSIYRRNVDLSMVKPLNSIDHITEHSGNIYFTLSNTDIDPYGFTRYKELCIIKTNITGDYVWTRTIPKSLGGIVESNLSSNNFELKDYKFMFANNKLNYCYVESRDKAPIQSGNTFTVDNPSFIYEKTMDKSNLVNYMVSEEGNITKKIIYENTKDYKIIPYSKNIYTSEGTLLMELSGVKKIKFVSIKL